MKRLERANVDSNLLKSILWGKKVVALIATILALCQVLREAHHTLLSGDSIPLLLFVSFAWINAFRREETIKREGIMLVCVAIITIVYAVVICGYNRG